MAAAACAMAAYDCTVDVGSMRPAPASVALLGAATPPFISLPLEDVPNAAAVVVVVVVIIVLLVDEADDDDDDEDDVEPLVVVVAVGTAPLTTPFAVKPAVERLLRDDKCGLFSFMPMSSLCICDDDSGSKRAIEIFISICFI